MVLEVIELPAGQYTAVRLCAQGVVNRRMKRRGIVVTAITRCAELWTLDIHPVSARRGTLSSPDCGKRDAPKRERSFNNRTKAFVLTFLTPNVLESTIEPDQSKF
jgi:hypothetical protein